MLSLRLFPRLTAFFCGGLINKKAVRKSSLKKEKHCEKNCLSLSCSGCVSLAAAKAGVIADWTFQTAASTNNIIGAGKTPGTTQSGISADIGAGTASASHASASTAWSIPSGNGSTNSWSANNWTTGDFFQFSVSTVGFTDITLSYDQTGSATGPGLFSLQYSTDGLTFSPSGGNNTISLSTWTPGTVQSGFTFSYNLSAISALDNAPSVFFRIVDQAPTTGGAINGGNVGTAGTDRVDNFIVNASPIPEPATLALGFVSGFACLVVLRRKL